MFHPVVPLKSSVRVLLLLFVRDELKNLTNRTAKRFRIPPSTSMPDRVRSIEHLVVGSLCSHTFVAHSPFTLILPARFPFPPRKGPSVDQGQPWGKTLEVLTARHRTREGVKTGILQRPASNSSESTRFPKARPSKSSTMVLTNSPPRRKR